MEAHERNSGDVEEITYKGVTRKAETGVVLLNLAKTPLCENCTSTNPRIGLPPSMRFTSSNMAYRCRSLSKPAFSLFKFSIDKPSIGSKSASLLLGARPSLGSTRPIARLGSIQSLFPLHSAVSSARLTSCLGSDSRSTRSLSQELGLSVPR